MPLKNKAEREKFLESYKEWELWKEIPEIEVKLYRYAFVSTGAVIIATEFPRMVFSRFCKKGTEYKKSTDVKYHLLLREGDKSYKSEFSSNDFKFYNPVGDSKTAIIDYLTKVKPEG